MTNTCPECGHKHPFGIMPLSVIGGPSGAGKTTVIPHDIENRIERRYFPAVSCLALAADAQSLRERLLPRPDWRGTESDAAIEGQSGFSWWPRTRQEAADNQIDVVDTSAASVVESADRVEVWFASCLGP